MTDRPPKTHPSVRELEVDGEITLYHEERRTALVLNGTASDVWRLIDGTRGPDEIAQLLARAYDADNETVQQGVRSALDQLRDHHVLDEQP